MFIECCYVVDTLQVSLTSMLLSDGKETRPVVWSGGIDSNICIYDAVTHQLIKRFEAHSSWVCVQICSQRDFISAIIAPAVYKGPSTILLLTLLPPLLCIRALVRYRD